MIVPAYGVYSQDPYAGTSYQEVAPYSAYDQPDPYAGPDFNNIAPY